MPTTTKSPTRPKSSKARPAAPVKKTQSPPTRVDLTREIPVQRTLVAPPVPQTHAAAPQTPPPGARTPGTRTPSRPGFFGRRGVQLLAVGVVSLTVGLVIGSQAKGSPGSSSAPSSSNPTGNVAAGNPAANAPKSNVSAPQHVTTPAKKPASTATHASAPKQPAAPTRPESKGWVVQSLTVNKDLLGDFAGSARIINTNGAAKSGTFTFTLSRNGHQLGYLQGMVDAAASGKTVTVELISENVYSAGSYTYDFQTDVSF